MLKMMPDIRLTNARLLFVAVVSAMLMASPAVAASSDSAQGSVQGSTQGQPANPEQVETELGDALKSVDEFAEEKTDAAIMEARQALKVADRFIERQQDRVSDAWSSMATATRDEARGAMQAIREKRSMAAEWLGGMKEASAESWTDVKQGFARAYEDLAAAVVENEEKAEPGNQSGS